MPMISTNYHHSSGGAFPHSEATAGQLLKYLTHSQIEVIMGLLCKPLWARNNHMAQVLFCLFSSIIKVDALRPKKKVDAHR